MTTKRNNRIIALAMVAVLALGNGLLLAGNANAASLTNTYLQLNRMQAGVTTSVRLVFKTTSAGATSVAINMNGTDATTWTGSSGVVNASQSVSSASCAATTGATALPGSITAAGSGSTITISSVTALAATTSYCVDLTSASAVTNATAGEYHPTITAGSDSTTVAVRTVSNDSIVVTAVVPPTFNLALGGNSDAFTANLSSGAVSNTTGVVATVNTNAKNGWFAWAKDLNTGLTSAAASKTISGTTAGSAATLSAGTEGYSVGVGSIAQGSGGVGTTSAVAAYSGANGGGLDTTLRQIVSSNGPASSTTFTVKEYAAISVTTPAATDYTDTITIVGAGSF